MSSQLTPKDVSEYRREGRCPYCKDDNRTLRLGKMQMSGDQNRYQEVACGACGAEFVEVYDFAGLFVNRMTELILISRCLKCQ